MTSSEKRKYIELLEVFDDDQAKTDYEWARWKCVTDLYWLGTEVLGLAKAKKRVYPKLHRWLCSVLQRDESILLLIPRGHTKTTWVEAKIVQEILKAGGKVRQFLLSRTERIAKQSLGAVKRHLANEVLRRLFPEVIPDPKMGYKGWAKSTENELHMRDYEDWTVKEPQVMAYGSAASFTGAHCDIIYLDDYINEKTCRSAALMLKAEEDWRFLQPILEVGGYFCVTGTFYHYNDLYNLMIKEKHFPKSRIYVRKAVENGKIIYPTIFTKKYLATLKAINGPYIFSCNPGYTPIWMSDMTFKKIEDVQVGDEVVGYEICAKKGKRRKLVKTKVISKNYRMAETVKIKLSSGREIICTEDHKWFTGRGGGDNHKTYLPAKIGRSLKKFCDPTDSKKLTQRQRELYQYLGGIIDGEGAVKYGSICITQSLEKNPEVFKKIKSTLDELNLDYKLYSDKREQKHNAKHFVLNGGKNTKLKILNYCDPAKRNQIIDNLWDHAGMKSPKDGERVIAIEPYKTEIVYALGTTTGNYVAWGYASKNCQYMLDPMPREEQIFPAPQPTCTEVPKVKGNWYILIDPAPTTGAKSDSTGFVVAFVDREKNIYFKEAFAVKLDGAAKADLLIQKCIQYKPDKVGIEFGLQEDLKYIIKTRVADYERRYHVKVPCAVWPIKIQNKVSKGDRIYRTLGSYVRLGKVQIVESGCRELLKQMDFFTGKGHEKDDVVDAASMLFPLVGGFSVSSSLIQRIDPSTGSFFGTFKRKKDNSWWSNFAGGKSA